MPLGSLFASVTPAPFAIPISDGSSSLDAWINNGSGASSIAEDVSYSNGSSGLSATNVQDAIDELALSVGSGGADIQTELDGLSTTRGAIIFRGATQWSALAPGTPGQILSTNGASADPAWVSDGTGGGPGGDFVGPASATDNAVVIFDGTTGKLGKNSSATVSATGALKIEVSATGGLIVSQVGAGFPTMELWTGGSNKAFWGLPVSNDQIVTGTVPGDLAFRTINGSIIFSSDNGASPAIKLMASDGWVFLPNKTPPGSNPSGGGYLFCDGGALKYRGSSGTVTTLGPA